MFNIWKMVHCHLILHIANVPISQPSPGGLHPGASLGDRQRGRGREHWPGSARPQHLPSTQTALLRFLLRPAELSVVFLRLILRCSYNSVCVARNILTSYFPAVPACFRPWQPQPRPQPGAFTPPLSPSLSRAGAASEFGHGSAWRGARTVSPVGRCTQLPWCDLGAKGKSISSLRMRRPRFSAFCETP